MEKHKAKKKKLIIIIAASVVFAAIIVAASVFFINGNEQLFFGESQEGTEESSTYSKQLKTFDAFDGVELVYEGASPQLSIDVKQTNTTGVYEMLTYSISDCDLMANGDVVTVTVGLKEDMDVEEYTEIYYGLVPESLTKNFTVDCDGEYVTSADDIPKEVKDEISQRAEELFSSSDGKMVYTDVSLENYYFALSKSVNGDPYNSYLLLYKATVQFNMTAEDLGLQSEGSGEYTGKTEFYALVEVNNVIYQYGNYTYDEPEYLEAYSFNKEVSFGENVSAKFTIYGFDSAESFENKALSKIKESYDLE